MNSAVQATDQQYAMLTDSFSHVFVSDVQDVEMFAGYLEKLLFIMYKWIQTRKPTCMIYLLWCGRL